MGEFNLVECPGSQFNPAGMEPARQPNLQPSPSPAGPPATGARSPVARPTTLRAVLAYRACDHASGGLICFLVLLSPWAFGTTQDWSIRVMNSGGFALGLLLAVKLALRWLGGHAPLRWQDEPDTNGAKKISASTLLSFGLAALTVMVLSYCLISAINARATYDPWQQEFLYHDRYIPWLPHSYDRTRTWHFFFNSLALACFFWAVRDWLLGRTAAEERAARNPAREQDAVALLPERLRRLLWLLCLNGVVLGIEAVSQRASGTNKLLWLTKPRLNADAKFQFGPYAYYANAAQYFNLIWPVALGFWWTLRRETRRSIGPSPQPLRRGQVRGGGQRGWFRHHGHHLLLPCVLVLAACPIISSSRGGALVDAAMMPAAAALLLFALRRRHPSVRFGLLLFFAAVLGFGASLGWNKLDERMRELGRGLRDREKIYTTAKAVAREFPVFGTGPGTFEPVFQLYRASEDEYWPAQLHNDWLETRITFGRVGCALLAGALLMVVARWFIPGGIRGEWPFASLLWLALAGCLAHARFDFPLQIYSIQLLFLLLCAILFCLSRLSHAGQSGQAGNGTGAPSLE